MYELITQNEANRIKQILNETGLKEDINIEVLNGKYKINAFNITESYKSEHYGKNKKKCYLCKVKIKTNQTKTIRNEAIQ